VDTINTEKFQVFIDGVQAGNVGGWKHMPLMVASKWQPGGDEEKYEVLAAIRRTYNPDEKRNIRGDESQTPSQIGRGEGFTQLSYHRAISSAVHVVIVPPVMAYSSLAPQPG
jgi:hypothetical protein